MTFDDFLSGTLQMFEFGFGISVAAGTAVIVICGALCVCNRLLKWGGIG